MKTIRKTLLTLTFLFASLFVLHAVADEPLDAPPPPPGGHGGGGNGQGAPIDGGMGILLTLGISYGGARLYKRFNTTEKETGTIEPTADAETNHPDERKN